MDQLHRLLGDRDRETEVGVAERASGDAAGEIEVEIAPHVPDLAARAAAQDDRLLTIILREHSLRRRDELRLKIVIEIHRGRVYQRTGSAQECVMQGTKVFRWPGVCTQVKGVFV